MSPVEKLEAFNQAFKLRKGRDLVLQKLPIQGCLPGLFMISRALVGEMDATSAS